MNKIWIKALLFTVIATQCGSAHAGWFDKKAEKTKQNTNVQVQQVKQNASVQVQQVKAALPIAAAAAMPKSNTSVAPAQPVAAASGSQGVTKFFDVGSGDVKSDEQLNRENLEKEKNRVRLSGEELEKMKAEMEKLNQSIKSVNDAKQAVANIKTDVKPVQVPVIPKMPALPNVQKTPLPVVAKPATLQNMKAPTNVSGYKK